MVLEVIELSKLVIYEVKVKNRVLELFIVWVFTTFVTAAGQQGVQNKNWNSRQHENWVLKQEYDQVGVQIGLTFVDHSFSNLESLKEASFIVLYQVYCSAHDGSQENPFYSCPDCKAAIAAWL